MRIDWQSSGSELLLNPRLPAAEAETLRARARELPSLPAHLWLTTSGSTAHDPGQLKWVALSKAAILTSAAAVNLHLESDARDAWIQVLPSFHVGGLGIWARSHLSGARVVDLHSASPKWDSAEFHRVAKEERVTLASLVPTQLFDLVRLNLRAPRSLRAIVIGGGALDEGVYRRARELGWPALPSYGLTECCSQVATAELASLESSEAAPMSLPRLLRHVEARIDASSGRLRIRSASLLTGYGLLGGDAAEFRDPKIDGWFLTEDRAEQAAGHLRCLGRADQLLKIGGESVDFSRLDRIFEEARSRVAPTLDAALVAVPDARLGHAIHLAHGAGGGVTELLEDFHGRILPIEKVRGVHALAAIPRSPLGKVLRGQLQKLVETRPGDTGAARG